MIDSLLQKIKEAFSKERKIQFKETEWEKYELFEEKKEQSKSLPLIYLIFYLLF